MTLSQKLYTVWAFFTINLKRLFRDRLALFFTFLFPLIFLFVFGGIFGGGPDDLSFNVAVVNRSKTEFSKSFLQQINNEKSFTVKKDINSLEQAKDKMSRSELDATILLPEDFGKVKNGHPSGQAVVRFTSNNSEAAGVIASILKAKFRGINAELVDIQTPFSVKSERININSLSQFDYAFTGLLGFAILGAGIFGPMNIFPELKKMGILRRLHTTPLRVWQFFLSNMLGNAATGLMSIAAMFLVALTVFDLKVVGDYWQLIPFLVFGTIMILGIGLAIGGWAKNERQAAPLGNIIVFPLMFLTGVFFPRFLMPEWLQSITAYVPLTPVIDGARLIITQGQNLVELGPQLAIMAVWTVVIYAVAFRVFRWE